MYRGKVTAVDASGVYVQTAEYGTLGPCQYVGAAPDPDDPVLVADVGGGQSTPDLVVLGAVNSEGVLPMGLTGWVDVSAHGAAGDDATDDTAAVQAALTAGAGKVVFVPPRTYRVSAALTVPAGTTVFGTGTIHQVTSGAKGLVVGGSGVTIDGVTLKGRHASTPTYTGNEHAIDATAANLAGAFKDLIIRDVKVSGWGAYGIFTKWIDGFTVDGCTITKCGYTGIGVQSGANGIVQGNRVQDIGPGSSGNMYGIALSYGSTEGAANPATRDVVVDSNIITGVNWEGIDTHSGLRITISSNQVLGCKTGIAFTQGDVGAATDCIVTGNLVDTLSDTGDGTKYALQIFGLLSGSTISVPASVVVTGNIFRRCAPVQLESTRGTIVSNNIFRESYQYCIFVLAGNDRLKITDNTFIDVWSVSESGYCIIVASDSHNTNGIVVNNQLARGSKTATWVNYAGLYVNASATGTAWKVGWNDFALASWDDYAGTYTPAVLPS